MFHPTSLKTVCQVASVSFNPLFQGTSDFCVPPPSVKITRAIFSRARRRCSSTHPMVSFPVGCLFASVTDPLR